MPWWLIFASISAGILIVCVCSFVYGFVARLRELGRPRKIRVAQAELSAAIERGDQVAEAAWAQRVTRLLAK